MIRLLKTLLCLMVFIFCGIGLTAYGTLSTLKHPHAERFDAQLIQNLEQAKMHYAHTKMRFEKGIQIVRLTMPALLHKEIKETQNELELLGTEAKIVMAGFSFQSEKLFEDTKNFVKHSETALQAHGKIAAIIIHHTLSELNENYIIDPLQNLKKLFTPQKEILVIIDQPFVIQETISLKSNPANKTKTFSILKTEAALIQRIIAVPLYLDLKSKIFFKGLSDYKDKLEDKTGSIQTAFEKEIKNARHAGQVLILTSHESFKILEGYLDKLNRQIGAILNPARISTIMTQFAEKIEKELLELYDITDQNLTILKTAMALGIQQLNHSQEKFLQTITREFSLNTAVALQSIESKLALLNPNAGDDNQMQEVAQTKMPLIPLFEEEEDKEGLRSFEIEQNIFETEAVLVAKSAVVISSSRDGKIRSIPFKNGEHFKKGDLLLAYDCTRSQAQKKVLQNRKNLADLKFKQSQKIIALGLVSDFEAQEIRTEREILAAEIEIVESDLETCEIRADFDGRVTNLLANPGEYTRTDRVLMEVASQETLNAEMLVPSIWLRWLDVGAPFSINVNETMQTYTARVKRIFGEIDPVTQSVQIVAELDPYKHRLLPGMGGSAVFDLQEIRGEGITGYLEKPLASYSEPSEEPLSVPVE